MACVTASALPRWAVVCLYAGGIAVGGFLLLQHWVHVAPIVPLLVILACPLMHLFMHRGHRHHRGGNGPDAGSASK